MPTALYTHSSNSIGSSSYGQQQQQQPQHFGTNGGGTVSGSSSSSGKMVPSADAPAFFPENVLQLQQQQQQQLHMQQQQQFVASATAAGQPYASAVAAAAAITTILLAIPDTVVGAILGRGGNVINDLQVRCDANTTGCGMNLAASILLLLTVQLLLITSHFESGARISVSQKGDFVPGTTQRRVTITGTPVAAQMAQYLITQRVQQACSEGDLRRHDNTNNSSGSYGYNSGYSSGAQSYSPPPTHSTAGRSSGANSPAFTTGVAAGFDSRATTDQSGVGNMNSTATAADAATDATSTHASSSNSSSSISSRSSNNSSPKGLQHHQRSTNMSIRIVEGQAAVARAAAAAAAALQFSLINMQANHTGFKHSSDKQAAAVAPELQTNDTSDHTLLLAVTTATATATAAAATATATDATQKWFP
eukprot:13305-Heterococcus_DN1.PRE.2